MCVCLRLHVVWWEVNVHAYDAYTHRGMSATTHSKRAVRVLTFHTAPAKTLLAVACASRYFSSCFASSVVEIEAVICVVYASVR